MNFSKFDEIKKIWQGPIRPSIYNPDVGLGYIILNKLKQNPDRVMQLCDDTGTEMTCGEMFSRTAKISTFLSSKSDLKQGDVVGIVARNSENVAPVAFACFTLGLPINPLAPVMGEREIVEMYSKTKPKAIFCDFDFVGKIQKIGLENCEIFTFIEKVEGFKFVDEILRDFNGSADDYEPPNLPNIPSTPLIILSSSGTSGSMKGITRSHKNWISELSTAFTEPYGENSNCFFSSTLHWITGIDLLVSSAIYQVKRVITTKNVDVDLFFDIFKRRKITTTMLAPYICDKIIKSEKFEVFESMRSVVIGGAAVTGLSFHKLQKIFPNALLAGIYGCSEGHIFSKGDATVKLGTSGVLLPNVNIKVIDESGTSLGPNEQGQICFKSPIPFDGYYNDPEATKLAYDPHGWCYTGDIGYFDSDGYIFVIDRVKHMLKYNHVIITPLDIEKIINEIEGVVSSCVVGVYDGGNDIIFAFVIKDEKKDLSGKFIENYVNEKVIDVKKIRGGVHFVTEFPLTPTGKIKNRDLKLMAEKIYKQRL